MESINADKFESLNKEVLIQIIGGVRKTKWWQFHRVDHNPGIASTYELSNWWGIGGTDVIMSDDEYEDSIGAGDIEGNC